MGEVEARFELASLSLNLTKPQFVLLQQIHRSWMDNTAHAQKNLAQNSLLQDVFHPSGLNTLRLL